MSADERERYRLWPSVLLLACATLVVCAPLLTRWDAYGWQDWDQFTTRHEVARLAVMTFGDWPVWNPYAEGGTVLLAHPHSPVLAPWFALTLLLGSQIAVRVLVVAAMWLGAVGMAVWLRDHRASRAAGVLAGILLMMSTHYVLHVTEGHLEWTALGVMPWVAVWLERAAAGRRRAGVIAALLLASVLISGNVYIPALFAIVLTTWSMLEAVRARTLRPVVVWGGAAALAVGLAAAKLIPTAMFVREYPREQTLVSHTSLNTLRAALFHPKPAAIYHYYRDEAAVGQDPPPPAPADLFEMTVGFHEAGAYLSAVGIALVCVGALGAWRRHWPLLMTGAVAGVFVLGWTSPIDLWAELHKLPFYRQLQLPSRMLAGVIFVAAFFGGLGLDLVVHWMRGRTHRAVLVGWLLIAISYGELAIQAHLVFRDVFRLSPIVLPVSPAFVQHEPPPQAAERVPHQMHSLLLPRVRANWGALDGYENLAVEQGDVMVVGEPGYRGEVFLTGADGTAMLTHWSMRVLTVEVVASSPGVLTVNQNFDRGWSVDVTPDTGATISQPAVEAAGRLLAAPVPQGRSRVTFTYWPRGLTAGLWLSALSLLAAAVWWRRP
jgi:hypothetical protein